MDRVVWKGTARRVTAKCKQITVEEKATKIPFSTTTHKEFEQPADF